ncbi:MAG: hypothetical protein QM764_04610 [Chitinophagaceae bacterium]
MEILFEKSHPKDLVEALKLVHQSDESGSYVLSYFDKSIDEKSLHQPILLLFDYKQRGLEVTTEELFKSGYRIFALKTKREEKLDFFKLSLTIIGLWPKILQVIIDTQSPFIFTYKYCGSRLVSVKE